MAVWLHEGNTIAAARLSRLRGREPAKLTEPVLQAGVRLAVYVSGQSEREFASQAPSRFAAGFAPKTFQELYDDSAFYSLAGSLVRYIDATHGRPMLRALVTARTNADALAALGTTEEALLRAWREQVIGPTRS